MERLDFASVMAVLRRNTPDENFGNQTDFLDSLFEDVYSGSQSAMELTEGFSFEDGMDEAVFITEVLCLAMQLRFEKRIRLAPPKTAETGRLPTMTISIICSLCISSQVASKKFCVA